MKKKVLVYPCGTEIGLEIFKAIQYSIHYELYGGSSTYDHGRFVYKNHIDNLPFINDKSDAEEIKQFNKIIRNYNIDYIYPAMDGVVTIFSKFRDLLTPMLIAPSWETTLITRSKRKTYGVLNGVIPVPDIYNSIAEIPEFPVFIKPDVGQGSVGIRKIQAAMEVEDLDFDKYLCLELLPGAEYTIDCFTNDDGKLIYCRGRGRNRIKNGISVNAVFVDNPLFTEYGKLINERIKQRGGWFFQLKEAKDGTLKLLEVASRIAGTSAISRCIGANLPLLTLDLYRGVRIEDTIINGYEIELDRALANNYHIKLDYDMVYIDYDDTVTTNGKLNLSVIKFLFQCVNNGKKIILLSKHEGDILQELSKWKISDLFDEVLHLDRNEKKSDYIKSNNAIFIDDSYGERKMISNNCGIYVFDTNSIECLLEE